MQSAPDIKHDLLWLLSNVNQPAPKQLESIVDQLRNVSHQPEQVSAVPVLSVSPGSPQRGCWEQVPSAF